MIYDKYINIFWKPVSHAVFLTPSEFSPHPSWTLLTPSELSPLPIRTLLTPSELSPHPIRTLSSYDWAQQFRNQFPNNKEGILLLYQKMSLSVIINAGATIPSHYCFNESCLLFIFITTNIYLLITFFYTFDSTQNITFMVSYYCNIRFNYIVIYIYISSTLFYHKYFNIIY